MPFRGNLELEQTRMTITDGREVFAKAVDMMTACSQDVLAAAGMRSQDIDWFVPHQANARIFDAVGRNLGIAGHAIVKTIADGNSSAVTIPLSLCGPTDKAGSAGRENSCGGSLGLSGGALVVGN